LRAALMAGLLLVLPFGPALAVSAVDISTSGQAMPKGTFSIFQAGSQTAVDTVRSEGDKSSVALLVTNGGQFTVTFTPDDANAGAKPASATVNVGDDGAAALRYDPAAGTLVPAASATSGHSLGEFARESGTTYGRQHAQAGLRTRYTPLIDRLLGDPEYRRIFREAEDETYNYYFDKLQGPGGQGFGIGLGGADF